MRKGIAAAAGLLFATVTPAAALAADDPGSTGVSIRVLPPEDPPAGEEPDGHHGKPVTHHADDDHRGGIDSIHGNVDGLNFDGDSGANRDSGIHRDSSTHRDSDVQRDSGVQGNSDVQGDSGVNGARPEELPFTGMSGDALLVLALAGAVASLEGAALIVLTRRRFRRSP
ncbi:hypothetical protein FDA94_22160 [Herbidospora galbida]|uniref:Gram-positive cocci surface proteins LPxTG domain-containing protein n=1 Tax=Herbidospora galbida TaxID=2575442 RepID=A0A4U3MB59_9ACTN|nr:hypothetical protein [Herbidospora galbida]TKK86231.1 hypothetical protein FDA94_22160 [Herbidospora galbida]